jgi:hypothetical protein
LASSVYNIWTLYAFVNISPLKEWRILEV